MKTTTSPLAFSAPNALSFVQSSGLAWPQMTDRHEWTVREDGAGQTTRYTVRLVASIGGRVVGGQAWTVYRTPTGMIARAA